jgi:hypothetical protein
MHFGDANIRSESRIISTDALTESICGYRLICVAALSNVARFPQSSQYPPGAISPPARHLAQIELGHEILRGARGHFELPGN